ncbi:MAG: hypothetical protein IIA73_01335 [Proteobacteria bacterium]|nr:hypothetical protein [Pseudomonadota bacterium]
MKNFPLTPNMTFVSEITARFREDSLSDDQAPGAGNICSVCNTAFWASMQSEEGRSVQAALALMNPTLSPSRSSEVLRLANPIELSSHSIAKLSASFPYRRGALAVTFPPRGRPLIWGIVLPKPEHEWLLEILAPGYIVIRNAFSIQAAVLPDGSRILFDERSRLEDEWCDLLFSYAKHTAIGRLIPFHLRFQFYGFLQELSRAMAEHRRGGSVVIVDPNDHDWKDAVDFTFEFNASEEYLVRPLLDLRKWRDRWSRNQERKRKVEGQKRPELVFYPDSEPERRLNQALRLIGGLTAVDGALVMTTTMHILGYGAKLKTTAKELSVREWLPFRGYASEPIRMEDISGTRHRSAAQFVFEHPEAIIFVASQDGRFTVFCSDEAGYEVLAHRIELLLL